MFTSRAEYRIMLRQDNADKRLTRLSYEIGLASQSRLQYTEDKYSKIDSLISFASSVKVKPDSINDYLISLDSKPVSETKVLSDIISRPEVSYERVFVFVPRGTKSNYSLIDDCFDSEFVPVSLSDNFRSELFEDAEIAIKYAGYIEREQKQADKIARLDDLKIPDEFDFNKVSGLSIECRQKLFRYKPSTIGQASRISGVSPSDISVLLVFFRR